MQKFQTSERNSSTKSETYNQKFFNMLSELMKLTGKFEKYYSRVACDVRDINNKIQR